MLTLIITELYSVMKERGQKILQKVQETEAKKFDAKWKASMWSRLKSFEDVGIRPNTKILSLWDLYGTAGACYVDYLKEAGFNHDQGQKFWGIIIRFLNDVGDTATIEDFQNITEADLENLKSYDRTEMRILERAFASSTK